MADIGGGSGSFIRGGKHTSKMRQRQSVSGGLMLTAMMDILTTILFFLMKNFSTIQSDFAQAKDLNLPYSTSITPPKPALQLGHTALDRPQLLLKARPNPGRPWLRESCPREPAQPPCREPIGG